jgi:uncharacterized protein YjbI with pentapeptide repeats
MDELLRKISRNRTVEHNKRLVKSLRDKGKVCQVPTSFWWSNDSYIKLLHNVGCGNKKSKFVFDRISFGGADFKGEFENIDFSEKSLAYVHFWYGSFTDTNFNNCRFFDCHFDLMKFSGCSFKGAEFHHMRIRKTFIEENEIKESQLHNCKIVEQGYKMIENIIMPTKDSVL